MKGVSENEFAPESELTRAMLVTALYRLDGEPEVGEESGFTDIAGDEYYAKAVAWAKQNGIVNGISDDLFAPNESITREQLAAIIYRYAVYKGYDVSVAKDTNILSYEDFGDISEYAVEAVQYAVGTGIIEGKTASTLNPKDFAKRGEIATVLQRFIEFTEK